VVGLWIAVAGLGVVDEGVRVDVEAFGGAFDEEL
jgi:hypothetical protein